MKRLLARAFSLTGVVVTFPAFVVGFLFHIGRNWFRFGAEAAQKLEDAWVQGDKT